MWGSANIAKNKTKQNKYLNNMPILFIEKLKPMNKYQWFLVPNFDTNFYIVL